MDANLKLIGIDAVKARLRHTADKVADAARKTMKRSADRIENIAKIQCPEDTSDLMKSIRQEKSYESRDAGGHGGRLAITVTFGGEIDGHDTDVYAMLVHENYESMHPGEGTIAKRAAYPDYYIGSKFLERAVQAEEPKLSGKMIEIVTAAIEDRDGIDLPEVPAPAPQDGEGRKK